MTVQSDGKFYYCNKCHSTNVINFKHEIHNSESYKITYCNKCNAQYYMLNGYLEKFEINTFKPKVKAKQTKPDNEGLYNFLHMLVIFGSIGLVIFLADLVNKNKSGSQPEYEAAKIVTDPLPPANLSPKEPQVPKLSKSQVPATSDDSHLDLGGTVMKNIGYLRSINGKLEIQNDLTESAKLAERWSSAVNSLGNVTATINGSSGKLTIISSDGDKHQYDLVKGLGDNYIAKDGSLEYIIKIVSSNRFKFAVASHSDNSGFVIDSKLVDINEPID